MSLSIPNYRILEKLGTGASSTLFHISSLQGYKHYTVKYIKVHTPEDMKFLDQLKDEHTTGTSVDHPIVRRVFELRYVRRRLRIKAALLFMEYVEGMAMNSSDYAYPMVDTLEFFARAAEGIGAIHEAGFVHADLKPGNLLITPQHRVKVIDLGQSCPINTAKSRVQGTIHYMAPEQAACKVVDARTDVFGLGATLYRVVTGATIATEMNRSLGVHAPGLLGMRMDELETAHEVDLPQSVERLIAECCAKDPADRPKDMAEFAEHARMARAILLTRGNAAANQATFASDPTTPT